MDTLQIKWHLKCLEFRKKKTNNKDFVYSKENGKNYTLQKNLNNKLQHALDNNEGNINGPLMNNEILNDDIIDDVQTQECKLNVSMKIIQERLLTKQE